MPKAPVQVLPEETPGRIQKVAEEVAEKPKPKPEPAPEPAPVRPAPDPELSYEEAMAALDQELGVDETAELLAPATPGEISGEPAESTGQPASSRGVVVSPELAAWSLETRRRIQSVWVTPAAFRGRGLATSLELRLSATGEVLGEPRVVGSSGDPYFDDNAVRAVLKANPLPPPPKPGQRVFVFRSEAD
jgi:TonB family protein